MKLAGCGARSSIRSDGSDGRAGYAPACANEWRPGTCEKPRIKRSPCVHRAFLALAATLESDVRNLFVLHGRMGRRQRVKTFDALVPGLPISWRGTLQHYAGRLHRDAESKSDVVVFDHVDSHPMTRSMWTKRAKGYFESLSPSR